MSDGISFKRLVATQFLTVFNDNLFKQSVLLIAVSQAASYPAMQSWAQALFSAPFFIFAAFAGDIADRLPRQLIVVWCKYTEALIMLVASLCFYFESNTGLLIVVALMGMQSAFLGPAKYGAIRDYQDGHRLAHANGVFQAFVLFGILLGTGSAGHLKSEQEWILGIIMAAVALGGAKIAKTMKVVPVSGKAALNKITINPIRKLFNGYKLATRFNGMSTALICHAAFWMCGSWMLLAWNEFLVASESSPSIIKVDDGIWSLGLASLSVFMGLGAFLCGKLLKANVPRLVPIVGASGMSIGLASCGMFGNSGLTIWCTLAIASFFSGFFLIPLRSFVQFTSPPESLGSFLGLSQMSDFGLVMTAAMIRPYLFAIDIGPHRLLLLASALMLTCAVFIFIKLPLRLELIKNQTNA